MRRYFQKNIFGFFLVFLFGIFIGWFLFHTPHQPEATTQLVSSKEVHPGVEPVILERRFASNAPDLAQMTTYQITRSIPNVKLQIYGKVEADPQGVVQLKAPMAGRLDKMAITETGYKVAKGQLLAQIYSPDFVSAQQKFLEAILTKSKNPAGYQNARKFLQKFGLNDAQIDAIEKNDRAQVSTDVLSDISGLVTAIPANQGDYVKKGSVIYELVDYTRLSISFEINDGYLVFIQPGDVLSFKSSLLPGKSFSGKIESISPEVHPKTRFKKIRMGFDNSNGALLPEMKISSQIPVNYEKYSDHLLIPQSAVVNQDSKAFVYVKLTDNNEVVIRAREVKLGQKIGDKYQILDGIQEGEELLLYAQSRP